MILRPRLKARRAHRIDFFSYDLSRFARPGLNHGFDLLLQRLEHIKRIVTRLPVHEETRVERVHVQSPSSAVFAPPDPSRSSERSSSKCSNRRSRWWQASTAVIRLESNASMTNCARGRPARPSVLSTGDANPPERGLSVARYAAQADFQRPYPFQVIAPATRS